MPFPMIGRRAILLANEPWHLCLLHTHYTHSNTAKKFLKGPVPVRSGKCLSTLCGYILGSFEMLDIFVSTIATSLIRRATALIYTTDRFPPD